MAKGGIRKVEGNDGLPPLRTDAVTKENKASERSSSSDATKQQDFLLSIFQASYLPTTR